MMADWELWGAPALLAAYYFGAWLKLGREPKGSSIAPRYVAPEGLSPAAVRYVRTSGCDGKSLAAALAQLAIQRRISLMVQGGKLVLQQLPAPAQASALAPEEQKTLDLAFAFAAPVVDVSDPTRSSVLVEAIEGKLRGQYASKFTNYNAPWWLAAMVLTLLFSALFAALGPWKQGPVFLTVWFLVSFQLVAIVLAVRAPAVVRSIAKRRPHLKRFCFAIFAGLVFIGTAAFVAVLIAQQASPQFAEMLVAFVLLNVAGIAALQATTPEGRRVKDEIEGYRQYLLAVEQDRLDRTSNENQPPQLDQHLPYAIALDVRENWGDSFADEFFNATIAKG